MSLNSQAKASFLAASFLKQKQREMLVSHLLSMTHASVKHALLTSHSSSSLFAKDVIRDSLTQVKEDSQLKLLKNHSSNRRGKQTASSASILGQRCGSSFTSSLSSSSSSYSRSASWSSQGSKRPASSLSHSSFAHKEEFSKVGVMSFASQDRRLSFPPFVPSGGTREQNHRWWRC